MQFFDNNYLRPARSGRYYVITDSGEHAFLNYSAKRHAWNVRDDADLYIPEHEIRVLCWAFRPRTDQAMMNMVRRG